MIRYALICDNAHEFESWFKDGVAHDRMSAAGLIECPVCGDTHVEKALMAPSLGAVKKAAAAEPACNPAACGNASCPMAAGF